MNGNGVSMVIPRTQSLSNPEMGVGAVGIAPGAPVSDPAGLEKESETRRIGDRRSARPIESMAGSSCGRWDSVGCLELGIFRLKN